LRNVVTFYETYGGVKNMSPDWKPEHLDEGNVLDRWIYMRLNLMREQITNAMDTYEIDKAVRPIGDFVEDLSVWYTRRSRDRFKDEGIERSRAISTMYGLLFEFSILIAPFMPFLAEEIYQKLKKDDHDLSESVHLENWPIVKTLQGLDAEVRAGILSDMYEVRKICSLALEARTKAKIKVRQPLATLKVKSFNIKDKNQPRIDGLINLIKEEVNVKEILVDDKITGEVELDTNITEDLKKEGIIREFLRNVQDLRKEKGLTPKDVVVLNVETDEASQKLLREFETEIKKTARFSEIKFGGVEGGEEFEIEEINFKVKI